MKNNFKYFLLLFLGAVLVSACVPEEDLIVYPGETDLVRTDPLLDVKTSVISFVAGTENYIVSIFALIPDANATTKLEVYSTYNDATSGGQSNEVLLTTFDLSKGENNIKGTLTYDDLKAGLTVDGSSLPDNEVDIPVGSSWDLVVIPVDGSGNATFGSKKITVAVLSPYAGLYRVVESAYYRIGAGPTIWNDQERFIGSVDANTFSYNDFWGNFANAGASFVFDLNDDNTITVLDDPSQLVFSGDMMLTCQEDGGQFTNVPCDGSNILIPDDVDGKHVIKLTYGYFTTNADPTVGGAREFYEVLEKIVD